MNFSERFKTVLSEDGLKTVSNVGRIETFEPERSKSLKRIVENVNVRPCSCSQILKIYCLRPRINFS
jgi:hypothetical protein